ncbi:hypothetical protein FVF58_44520 [Paraburkholderia panacisoli]|uniref:Uncharacterized protein n=1 Tax=Paraburkholderia panacisoli TaxID=2603818 RepID=A0A5B0G4Y5_9BURK|nr:hypothetical protein [Paraburkholderia panacisoli]KAA0998444.1 hypothetical protein FVF58_44520 [Paraburkholderia panacisoli]
MAILGAIVDPYSYFANRSIPVPQLVSANVTIALADSILGASRADLCRRNNRMRQSAVRLSWGNRPNRANSGGLLEKAPVDQWFAYLATG